jgi:hypothetical protein
MGVLRATFPGNFSFDESAYQNLAEFIGIIVMVAVLVERGTCDCTIQLRGDSTTALAWASGDKVGGEQRNNAAAIAFRMMSLRYRVSIGSTGFINSKANYISDTLSWGLPMGEYGEWYAQESNYYPGSEGGSKSLLLDLCFPRRVDDGSMGAYMASWARLELILQQFDKEIVARRSHPSPMHPYAPTATNPTVS